MKYLLSILFLALLAGCAPLQYVYVDPKDSVVKKQRVIYDYQYMPLFYTPVLYNVPTIIQRWSVPRYQPQRWIPQRPTHRFVPPRQLPPRPSRKR
jgi:PBP1b-binding outer membrane lipoprotein LpoB